MNYASKLGLLYYAGVLKEFAYHALYAQNVLINNYYRQLLQCKTQSLPGNYHNHVPTSKYASSYCLGSGSTIGRVVECLITHHRITTKRKLVNL